ncbi:hypothetical protein JOE11_002797 [Robbsia andropogonis]
MPIDSARERLQSTDYGYYAATSCVTLRSSRYADEKMQISAVRKQRAFLSLRSLVFRHGVRNVILVINNRRDLPRKVHEVIEPFFR